MAFLNFNGLIDRSLLTVSSADVSALSNTHFAPSIFDDYFGILLVHFGKTRHLKNLNSQG